MEKKILGGLRGKNRVDRIGDAVFQIEGVRFAVTHEVELAVDWLKTLRPATVGDYYDWFMGYIERFGMGDVCIHDDNFPGKANIKRGLGVNYFVAAQDIVPLTPLFGGQAIKIIVPEGISIAYSSPRQVGNNHLFYMDGFRHESYTFEPGRGPGERVAKKWKWVYVYRDMIDWKMKSLEKIKAM